ncbi:MAG: DUF1653 domain-containing protein [Roseburia sp.]
MERIPASGEIYRHFKNKLYQIVAVAEHSETREKLVIYQALYGTYKVYARPLAMFVSEVDHDKYPEVTQKYRFERVTPGEDAAGTERVEAAMEYEAKQRVETAPERVQAAAEYEAKQRVETAPEHVEKQSAEAEPEVNPKLMQFLDTDDFEEKYNILVSIQNELDDNVVNAMAVSLDIILPEGDLEERYEALKYGVRTRGRYESVRLR